MTTTTTKQSDLIGELYCQMKADRELDAKPATRIALACIEAACNVSCHGEHLIASGKAMEDGEKHATIEKAIASIGAMYPTPPTSRLVISLLQAASLFAHLATKQENKLQNRSDEP